MKKIENRPIGFLARVFGCWHKNKLSRPFFDEETGQTYRVCLNCGARQRFDPERLKTTGRFYFPPAKLSS
ncbi:MAG: hypothetical protein N2Z23_10285 [Pyrinomonadaceae bacterium]|nr:hypothetical protein [Pyrinomonadaceae bacterium]MCX7640812.1 hypothetical protein [Pyrinomonadaceae bacterium]MDW8303423.1 hypothetical protein [Acidobacteriota bacterium]